MGMFRHRAVAITVGVVVLVAAVPLGGIADHDGSVTWPTDETRLFYSDDPDSGDATAENVGIAEVVDISYRTTRSASAEGRTLADYRKRQLRSIDRTRDD
ncbi:MAG: hypothetical protein ABEI99_06465, partial [Halobaculum sp.]